MKKYNAKKKQLCMFKNLYDCLFSFIYIESTNNIIELNFLVDSYINWMCNRKLTQYEKI